MLQNLHIATTAAQELTHADQYEHLPYIQSDDASVAGLSKGAQPPLANAMDEQTYVFEALAYQSEVVNLNNWHAEHGNGLPRMNRSRSTRWSIRQPSKPISTSHGRSDRWPGGDRRCRPHARAGIGDPRRHAGRRGLSDVEQRHPRPLSTPNDPMPLDGSLDSSRSAISSHDRAAMGCELRLIIESKLATAHVDAELSIRRLERREAR